MPRLDWSDLNTGDFAALAGRAPVALVPVGAIEQHGPHLPLSTDAVLAEAVACRAATLASACVLKLPVVSVGKSDEHLSFPGTLSLDAATLGAVLGQIGRSVARSGVGRIVFLNAHGGNLPVLQTVVRALRREAGMFAVAAGWMSMGYPEGLIPAEEIAEGIHGGLVETAAMLHLRPDLVAMEKARHFVPTSAAVARDNRVLRLLGPVGAGWVIEDLHPEGACGNAAMATAELGAALIGHAAQRYALLLDEVAAHPLPGDGRAGALP